MDKVRNLFKQPWTDEHINFIKENYLKMSQSEMAKHLRRTKSSINHKCHELQLLNPNRRNWTKEEDDFLRDHYMTLSILEIANKINRTEFSIQNHLRKLSLNITKDQIKVGDKFGRWTVIDLFHKKSSEQSNRMAKCKCDCGNIKTIKAYFVYSGKSKSCGCYHKDVSKEMVVARSFKHGRATRKNRDPIWTMWFHHKENMCEKWKNDYLVFEKWVLENGYERGVGLQAKLVDDSKLVDENNLIFLPYNYSPIENKRLYRIWVGLRQRCSNPKNRAFSRYGKRGIKVCKEWSENYLAFQEWALNHGYEDRLTLDRISVDGNYCPENCRWFTHKQQSNNKSVNRFITAFNETKTISEWAEDSRCAVADQTLRTRLNRGWEIEKAILTPSKIDRSYIKKNVIDKLLYSKWYGVKSRCNNQSNMAYKDYGGRGIKICEEWHDYLKFQEWSLNNGYSKNLTIDRIDVNGNYEPSNCRWVSRKVQARNKRNTRYETIFGETKCLTAWFDDPRSKVDNVSMFDYRVKSGMTNEEALTIPSRRKIKKAE